MRSSSTPSPAPGRRHAAVYSPGALCLDESAALAHKLESPFERVITGGAHAAACHMDALSPFSAWLGQVSPSGTDEAPPSDMLHFVASSLTSPSSNHTYLQSQSSNTQSPTVKACGAMKSPNADSCPFGSPLGYISNERHLFSPLLPIFSPGTPKGATTAAADHKTIERHVQFAVASHHSTSAPTPQQHPPPMASWDTFGLRFKYQSDDTQQDQEWKGTDLPTFGEDVAPMTGNVQLALPENEQELDQFMLSFESSADHTSPPESTSNDECADDSKPIEDPRTTFLYTEFHRYRHKAKNGRVYSQGTFEFKCAVCKQWRRSMLPDGTMSTHKRMHVVCGGSHCPPEETRERNVTLHETLRDNVRNNDGITAEKPGSSAKKLKRVILKPPVDRRVDVQGLIFDAAESPSAISNSKQSPASVEQNPPHTFKDSLLKSLQAAAFADLNQLLASPPPSADKMQRSHA